MSPTSDIDWTSPRIDPSPPAERRLFSAIAALLALVLFGSPFAMLYEARYHAWPWKSVPSQFHWCGRDYVRHGPRITEPELLSRFPDDVPPTPVKQGTNRVPLGRAHDIVTYRLSDFPGWSCDGQRREGPTLTYVHLRVSNSYQQYNLVGGP